MENKIKDAPKTKDALKQLQADMRQLQALLAEGRAVQRTESPIADESTTVKTRSEVAVQYSVSLPP